MKRSARRGPWKTQHSVKEYGIDAWGRGFFAVNEKGHLTVGNGTEAPPIDLKDLVDEVGERGIAPPLLIRFSDLLKARIKEIHQAFAKAMKDYDYRGQYRGVYPIKVNQNQLLVDDLVSFGEQFHYGLEAGSKPELLAVIAMLQDPEALIVCNGYKDAEYVETALLASRLGPKIVLVVEKPSELPLILELARKLEIKPQIGIRARLFTRGAGHWEASGGDRSKFGLGTREIVEAVERLREEGQLENLVLLHFHLGSQISSIRNVKDALREGTWLYVNLVRMGAPLVYFDVGGGLGVDYIGTQRNLASSMNYSLQEYANDIVYGVMEVCDPAEVAHPILVTEAGRATVAHHAALIVEVLGVREFQVCDSLPSSPPKNVESSLAHLFHTYNDLGPDNVRETYHDALQYRDECLTLFKLGHLSLEHRMMAEDVFSAICQRIRTLIVDFEEVPSELKSIEETLADTYFSNFSLFQSLPDAWAIDQLFPIVPIHRLDERPTRRGVIADMTCDSDGQLERFIQGHRVRPSLALHSFDGGPYYLGIFLVGAYQEILGDLHNLFGDTNTVQVSLDPKGGYNIEHVVPGNSVTQVLRYVGYEKSDLVARVRRSSEAAIRESRMSRQQARQLLEVYRDGLTGYTYLEPR